MHYGGARACEGMSKYACALFHFKKARQPKVDPVTTEKMQQLKRRGPHGATQAPESPAAGEATQTLHEVTENTEVPPVNTVAQPPAAGLARFAPMVLWIAMMWWFSR